MQNTNSNARNETMEICRIANDHLRQNAFKIDFNYYFLAESIEEDLDINNLYTNVDFSHDPEHKMHLIRFIIEEFIRIRATHIAKKITLNEQKKLLHKKNLRHFAAQ